MKTFGVEQVRCEFVPRPPVGDAERDASGRSARDPAGPCAHGDREAADDGGATGDSVEGNCDAGVGPGRDSSDVAIPGGGRAAQILGPRAVEGVPRRRRYAAGDSVCREQSVERREEEATLVDCGSVELDRECIASCMDWMSKHRIGWTPKVDESRFCVNHSESNISSPRSKKCNYM